MPEIELSAKAPVEVADLYSTEPPKYEDRVLRLIPYHAFANRGADNSEGLWQGQTPETTWILLLRMPVPSAV